LKIESGSLQKNLSNLRITTDLDITLSELEKMAKKRLLSIDEIERSFQEQKPSSPPPSLPSHTQPQPQPQPQQKNPSTPITKPSIPTKPPSTKVIRKMTLANKLFIDGKEDPINQPNKQSEFSNFNLQ
jgi:hypothetical protein